jgi:hypothetical protein
MKISKGLCTEFTETFHSTHQITVTKQTLDFVNIRQALTNYIQCLTIYKIISINRYSTATYFSRKNSTLKDTLYQWMPSLIASIDVKELWLQHWMSSGILKANYIGFLPLGYYTKAAFQTNYLSIWTSLNLRVSFSGSNDALLGI